MWYIGKYQLLALTVTLSLILYVHVYLSASMCIHAPVEQIVAISIDSALKKSCLICVTTLCIS